MKTFFLPILVALLPLTLAAQSDALYDVHVAIDPLEVRMLPLNEDPQSEAQRALRDASGWNEWSQERPTWRAIMGDVTGLPHRAFGPALAYDGATVEEKATAFAASDLTSFGIEFDGAWTTESKMGKHTWAHAQQFSQGIPVKGGKLVTKWWNGQLVMWGADWYRDVPQDADELLSPLAQQEAVTAGVNFQNGATWRWANCPGCQPAPMKAPLNGI